MWKNFLLPSILNGVTVINRNENDVKRKVANNGKNGVYGKSLGAYKGTAIAALKGEIDTSDMKSRIIKNRLMYLLQG